MRTQMMLQSEPSEEDSARYSYNFVKCGLQTKERKSNNNCLLMQRTATVINSCFCVLTIIPFSARPSAK